MRPTEPAAVALVDHVAGEGPPLLLLHGGSGSHRHWERVVAPLAQRFAVHAPDLPGYGDSPDAPGDPDGDAYVELVAGSLSALVPPGPVDLVGFSFGGAVAAGVARAWGSRVRRLTLIGPGGFGKPAGRRIASRSRAETDGSPEQVRDVLRYNLGTMMFADPAAIDEATVDLQVWNLAHARFDSLRVSLQDRVVNDLAHVRCPVQIIWGARDVLAHPSTEHRAARIRAAVPDVRIELVEGAGHWVQFEAPDAVARLLNDFHAPTAAPLEKL